MKRGSGTHDEKNAGYSKKIVDNQLVLTLSGNHRRGGAGEPGRRGPKELWYFSWN